MGRVDLTMLNGIGHYDLMQSAGPAGKTCLLIQSSPRHFPVANETPWPPTRGKVIKQMSGFDFYISASETVRREWAELGAFGGKPSFYVPNRCDDALALSLSGRDKSELRAELGLPRDRFLIVCVASIQHRKGQDLIVDRIEQIAKEIPSALLLLVGPVVGHWGAAVVRRAHDSQSANAIRVLPPQPQAMDLIRAADVLLLPSRAEAMPLVVLEAMAVGTPVVATDVDGIPEIIDHGRSGLLFSLDTPDSMVSLLSKLAFNSSVRDDLAQQASDRYWAEFSTTRQVARLDSILNSIARNAPIESEPAVVVRAWSTGEQSSTSLEERTAC
jgi:glycosyltransferase involved in cell wall biosynthesis